MSYSHSRSALPPVSPIFFSLGHRARAAISGVTVVLAVLLGAPHAFASSLTRTADVAAPAATVWAAIGGFCAIKDWHPVIGTCVLDGKTPATRTLVSKDGKVAFVETEMARDDAKHFYSYNFLASPLPATKYLGTIRVEAHGSHSTIVWHGEFTAEKGKDKDVETALAGIYESGLAALKTKFAQPAGY